MHVVLCELDLAIDNFPVHDLDEFSQAVEYRINFADWLTGVEDLQNKTPEELWTGLGLKSLRRIPLFNKVEDASGMVDPWSQEWQGFLDSEQGIKFGPRWHQLVGITKMCELIIRGEPLLLMDQVSVGKTLQTVGSVVMYPLLRGYYKKNGCFPLQFSKLTSYLLVYFTNGLYCSAPQVQHPGWQLARPSSPHHRPRPSIRPVGAGIQAVRQVWLNRPLPLQAAVVGVGEKGDLGRRLQAQGLQANAEPQGPARRIHGKQPRYVV